MIDDMEVEVEGGNGADEDISSAQRFEHVSDTRSLLWWSSVLLSYLPLGSMLTVQA